MQEPSLKKQNVDLSEVFDKAIDALNRYPEKNVVGYLIEQVLEMENGLYEDATIGMEEIEKLSAHQEEMARIREESSRSKWDRLTTLSMGDSPPDDSSSDLEEMVEYLNSRQELAEKLIKQHESILKLLEKELEEMLNDSVKPGRKKELRELYDVISS